jgi:CrcB protein
MVFIGGGLGSLCRYGIARWMSAYEWSAPLGTFIANMLACLVLGLLMGYHLKNGMTDHTRLLLATGFCGGFSTFSTFSYENFDYLQTGDYTQAFLYTGASVLLGLLCVFVGFRILA